MFIVKASHNRLILHAIIALERCVGVTMANLCGLCLNGRPFLIFLITVVHFSGLLLIRRSNQRLRRASLQWARAARDEH
jgi:hypothetical protein